VTLNANGRNYYASLRSAVVADGQFSTHGSTGILAIPEKRWIYHFLTVRQFSGGLGVFEVGIAILIALRSWSPRASALGSMLAVLMFLTTLSFLFSTPGWEPSLGGFPFLSGAVGQFLIKDVVLLGAAMWSLGEALAQHVTRASREGSGDHRW
jgi:reactive chlorine resistance protein C